METTMGGKASPEQGTAFQIRHTNVIGKKSQHSHWVILMDDIVGIEPPPKCQKDRKANHTWLRLKHQASTATGYQGLCGRQAVCGVGQQVGSS